MAVENPAQPAQISDLVITARSVAGTARGRGRDFYGATISKLADALENSERRGNLMDDARSHWQAKALESEAQLGRLALAITEHLQVTAALRQEVEMLYKRHSDMGVVAAEWQTKAGRYEAALRDILNGSDTDAPIMRKIAVTALRGGI